MMRFLAISFILTIFSSFLYAEQQRVDSFVVLPKLPVVEKPVRHVAETKEAFAKRVQLLHTVRMKEVFATQRSFRLAVEDRNRRLVRGEVKQSPSLPDPYDPLFLAYKDVDTLRDVNDDLSNLLNKKHTKIKGGKSWLFLIAIEEYQYTDPVLFARRTGEIVKATFQKKLDISERNIITLYDKEATIENISTQLRKLLLRVQRNDVVYFYYCGHGLSNRKGEQLILPYEGMPDFADSKNSLKIERLYNKFLNSKALRTFSFVDASFNGITDGTPILKGLKKLNMRPRAEGYHKRLNILNSTRGQDSDNAYYEKEYRLFSYFLTKEVLSRPQNAGELFDNIRTKIRKVSSRYGEEHLQEPEFFGYRELTIQN
jgi:hypothetical protein